MCVRGVPRVLTPTARLPRLCAQLRNVWSYRGKTAKRWGQGVGLGLPLARLYAKYFGGNLQAVPMEGHGTDCYVRVRTLPPAHSNVIAAPGRASGDTERLHARDGW